MKRNLFYGFLLLCFGLGAYSKLWDVNILGIGFLPFLGLAFCGAIGLLSDYIWRIRKSAYSLIPLLLCIELVGILLDHTGFRIASSWFYNISATLLPTFGFLLIYHSLQKKNESAYTAYKLIGLGLLCILAAPSQYLMYIPGSAFAWMNFRFLFLAIFAMLLIIDFTVDFEKLQLTIEKQLIRVGLLLISVKYFADYIFV